METAVTKSCNFGDVSKLYADGRPSKVLNATFPPVRGEMSENSSVQIASCSLFLVTTPRLGRP